MIMQNPEDCIHHELGKIFAVNPKSIGPPTQYFGNKASYVTLENGRNAQSFSSFQNVQDTVKTLSVHYTKRGEPYLNMENILLIVTTDLRLIIPLNFLHQEPPTINI